MSTSGIYALLDQKTDGSINTGLVDIKLQTYKINSENEETEYTDSSEEVLPGKLISFIPKVTNNGADCYVRVKIDYIDENTNFLEFVSGFSDDLKKYGDYYYYKDVLHSGDTLKVFDTIQIPGYIKQEEKDKVLYLKITAEAIQKKNFEPDYSTDKPWKNIVPTESIKSSYDISDKDFKITIRYKNNANKDISIKDNFFENMNIIMPGDEFKDSLTIVNNNKIKTKYYLELGKDEKRTNERELLKQIRLVITNKNGQVVYDGSLLNDGKILLGEYEPNGFDTLEFKISIPIDLSNKYELLNPDISFIFSEEGRILNPQTGDTIDWAITIFFISSIGLIVIIILGYREKTKEEC